MRIQPHWTLRLFATSCLTFSVSAGAVALPAGGVVSGGSAVISNPSAGQLNVKQSSNRAVIDWRSFDVGAGERVNVAQPSNASILLNRVNDAQASRIDGQITANGQVIIANPNGVIFGKGARVDVGGLIATSSKIDAVPFMQQGILTGQPGNPDARVENAGTLTAGQGGLVALVAPEVANSGLIIAHAGKVQLAAGDTIAYDLYGDGLLSVAASPKERKALVSQSGIIDAAGGTVALSASQAGQLVDSAVNMDGMIEATSLTGTGGTVTATADHVTLGATAKIHADGAKGGGAISLGGGYQGTGPLPWAKEVSVAAGAVITASGTKGNAAGGKVVLWSHGQTSFAGAIMARGHGKGAGGTVETSSKGALDIAHAATVDASSDSGNAGSWLLDPGNITLVHATSSASDANDSVTGGTHTPTSGNDSTVSDFTINAALNGGTSVVLQTSGTDTNITNTGSPVINYTGSGTLSLTLKATGSIALSNTTIQATGSGKLNTILWSDSDNNSSGAISLTTSTITTHGGTFTAAGGLDNGANGGVAGDGLPDGYAYGNAAYANGVLLSYSSMTTGGGNILLRGHGYDAGTYSRGVDIESNTIATTSGTLTLAGTGGAGTNYDFGTYLSNNAITSQTGNVLFSGKGGAGSQDTNWGVYINTGSLNSTGTGASAATITIQGTGGGGTHDNDGVVMGNNSIGTVNGNIAITGTGGSDSSYTARGVFFYGGTRIASTGTGASAGTISLTGTGGTGNCCHTGLALQGANTITSVDGNIGLTGTGTGYFGTGIQITGGTTVTSTGTDAAAATITLYGTGGTGGDNATGIILSDAGTALVSSRGAVSLTGVGGAGGASEYGVQLTAGARITATGIAPVTISGTGGAGTNNNYGIYLNGNGTAGGTAISTVDGAVTLSGIGRGSGSNNYGIDLDAASSLVSTGAGTVTLTGTGSSGTGTFNQGVYIGGASTQVSVINANLAINGTSVTGSGGVTYAVSVDRNAVVQTTGTGNISLSGINNETSQYGAIGLGISGTVRSTASSNGGTISLTGTSGVFGAAAGYGVQVAAGSGQQGLVSSVSGAINITGVSRGTSGYYNFGINLETGGSIVSTGSAPIVLTGTGGANTAGIGSLEGPAVIGSPAMTGDITFNTDTFGFSSFTATTQGNIVFKPITASTSIGVMDGTGTLQLTSAVIASLNPDAAGTGAGKLIIGDAAAGTGAINVNAWDLSGKTYGVELHGGSITQAGAITWNQGNSILLDSRVSDLNPAYTLNDTGSLASSLTLESPGSIIIDGNKITNSGGGLLKTILWSNDINFGLGSVSVTGLTLNTNGGSFIAAGGLDDGSNGGTAGDGVPDGFARGNTSYASGVSISGSSISTGAGDILLRGHGYDLSSGIAQYGVYLTGGSTLAATAGGIALTGTGGNGAGGNTGIYLNGNYSAGGTSITTVDGAVALRGVGQGTGNGNNGVYADNAAQITSSGTGTITLNGTGSASGGDNNSGVTLFGSNTLVTSSTGAIAFNGTGGGSGNTNYGIKIESAANVASTGTGAGAASITLNGTGGNGSAGNDGIYINGYGLGVSTVDGTVTIAGTGQGSGAGYGLVTDSNAHIVSTGTGTINLSGTGSQNGTNFNSGILMIGGTNVSSAYGAIELTGIAGGSGGGGNNNGIWLHNGSQISSTGTGASAATITLHGTGGAGTGFNPGIYIDGDGSAGSTAIITADGAVSLTGIGGGTYENNFGIILDAARIASTGTGASAGTITLHGTGGAGTDSNAGIYLHGNGTAGGTAISTVDGAVSLSGLGQGSGDFNHGIEIDNAAQIVSTGLGEISLQGAGSSSGAQYNNGIHLAGLGSLITSSTGAISLIGNAMGNDGSNYGVVIDSGGDIASTSSGSGAASITLSGTGALGWGVYLNDIGHGITTIDGTVSIIGISHGIGWNNNGIGLDSNTRIVSTGTGAIDLSGTGGTGGTNGDLGILIQGGSVITSGYGAIHLTGIGGGTGTGSYGIDLTGGSQISSTGIGLNAAAITLNGTGANGTDNNYGIYLQGNGTTGATAISSVDGAVSLTGVGQGSGMANLGIDIDNAARVISTGNGAMSLIGTAGAGTHFNFGVRVDGNGVAGATAIATMNGGLLIDGTGSGSIDSAQGVRIDNGALVSSTGNGTVTLNGTGGNNTGNDNTGVLLDQANARVSSATGNIVIHGIGGGSGSGNFGIDVANSAQVISTGTSSITLTGTGGAGTDSNFGIYLHSAQVISAGTSSITLTGIGGAGTDSNFGIYLHGNGAAGATAITTIDGAVSLTGAGAGNGASDSGIVVDNAARIVSTGNGILSLYGTGGAGTASNYGVFINGIGSAGSTAITTLNGAVVIDGTGAGSSYAAQGIRIDNGALVSSTGSGTLTLNGTGGNNTGADNLGVLLSGVNTLVTSANGKIEISGTGGGTSIDEGGLLVQGGAGISSTGTGASAAAINLNGTAASSGNNAENGILFRNQGFLSTVKGAVSLTGTTYGQAGNGIDIDDSTLTTVNGNLTLNGANFGTGFFDYGIHITDSANIASTGTGAISFNGVSSHTGTGYAIGTLLDGGVSLSTNNGAVTITGTGGGNGSDSVNQGVRIGGSRISSTGTGAITLSGTGGAGTDYNYGIYLNGNGTAGGTAISTVDGAVSLTGVGGGSGHSNAGIAIDNAAGIASTGNGAIALHGTGGNGTNNNYGILLEGASIFTTSGTVSLTGVGHGSGDYSEGIIIANGARISSSGTGSVTLSGTGSSVGNYLGSGIILSGGSIDTGDGDVSLTGIGGGNTYFDSGIGLENISSISSTGTGTITLNGTGSADGAYGSYGIELNFFSGITAAYGAVTLNGTGKGAGGSAFNIGILLQQNSGIASTGTGAGAASITLHGTGGNGTDNNVGVYLYGNGTAGGTAISTVDGAVSLTGVGGGGSGQGNDGIHTYGGAQISSTGSGITGTIGLNGTGGNGTIYNEGLELVDSSITTKNAAITLYGQGGQSSSFGGRGVQLVGGTVVSTGNAGGTTGDIAIIGIGGPSLSADNTGILLQNGITVSTNRGAITLDGTTHDGGVGSLNQGISFDSGTTAITSASGNITLSGHGSGDHAASDGNGDIATWASGGAGSYTIGSSSSTGTIRINADTIYLANFDASTQNDISVHSYSPSTSIGVAGGAGTLQLTSATLGELHADVDGNGIGYLNIGRKTQNDGSGDIHIGAYSGWNSTVVVASNTGQIYVDGAEDFTAYHGFQLLTNADPHINATVNAGYFVLTPTVNNVSIGLAGGTGTVNLSPAELDNISVYYNLGIGNASFADPITFGAYANWRGNTTFDSASSIAVNGDQAAASGSNGSLSFNGPVSLGARIDLSASSGAGNITFAGPVTLTGNAGVRTSGSGAIAFGGSVDGAYNFSLNNTGSGGISLGGALGGTTALGNVTIASASALSLPSIRAATITAQTVGAYDLTLGAGTVLSASGAGSAVTLAAGRNFVNNAGSSAIGLTGGGRYLVYSADPANDSAGGLASGFLRYSCNYGGACPSFPASGNGFLYSTTPLLTVTPNAVAVTYGNGVSLAGYGYTLSGYRAGDLANDSVSGTVNGGTTYAPGADVGSYNINYANGALSDALGYGFTYANAPTGITVNRASLSITTDDRTRLYGVNNPTFTGTISGVYGSDGITVTRGTAATAGSNIGSYTITDSLNDPNSKLGNYNVVSNPAGTLTINPTTLTIAADNQSKIYGNADPALTYSASGLFGGDAISGALTRSAGETVAGGPYAIGQGTLSAGSNYVISYSGGSFTITPRPLTVAADDATRTTTDPDPAFGYTVTGWLPGDPHAALSGVSLTTPASAGSPAGMYDIIASGGTVADSNYALGGYLPGIITITSSVASPPPPLSPPSNSPSLPLAQPGSPKPPAAVPPQNVVPIAAPARPDVAAALYALPASIVHGNYVSTNPNGHVAPPSLDSEKFDSYDAAQNEAQLSGFSYDLNKGDSYLAPAAANEDEGYRHAGTLFQLTPELIKLLGTFAPDADAKNE